MIIYLAEIRRNDWDEDWWTVGAYSTREKAEKSIKKEIETLDEPILSLEIYDSNKDKEYLWNIATLNLDDEVENNG